MHVDALFREHPEQWGLRGDPHLWAEMEQAFRATTLPGDRATLARLLAHEFERLAGVPLSAEGPHHVARFDTGGMSSGHISPRYWREVAMPLLLQRGEALLAARASRVSDLLQQAKSLAREYRAVTGKPLGITGEVAEFTAAQILGLSLSGAREAGYDAVKVVDGREVKVQIKGRCIAGTSGRSEQIGSIKLGKPWDTVILVLLDDELEAVAMYEATRPAIEAALLKPGSRARNERGSLAVSKFKQIAKAPIWVRARA